MGEVFGREIPEDQQPPPAPQERALTSRFSALGRESQELSNTFGLVCLSLTDSLPGQTSIFLHGALSHRKREIFASIKWGKKKVRHGTKHSFVSGWLGLK